MPRIDRGGIGLFGGVWFGVWSFVGMGMGVL